MQRSLIGFEKNTVLSPSQHFGFWFGEGCFPYQSDHSQRRLTLQIYSERPKGLRSNHLTAVGPTFPKAGPVSGYNPDLLTDLIVITARLKQSCFTNQKFIGHELGFMTNQPISKRVQTVRQDISRILFLLIDLLFFRFLIDVLKKLQSFP